MLSEFINENKLSRGFEASAVHYFVPLAELLHSHQFSAKKPFFVGINGSQGSGKSTLADFLSMYLSSEYALNVVVLSLDDFYFDKTKRNELAETVHPLLATRGVPGTHDTSHIQQVLDQLKRNQPDVIIPRFDKATDNPYPKQQWAKISRAVDIVLFEGWCWGVSAQSQQTLVQPVNQLEQSRDENQQWRQYVNTQLSAEYEPLYRFFDSWIMLKAPSFDDVYNWRLEQENKLREKTKQVNTSGIMSPAQIHNFIQHYQRLTEHALTTLPAACDHVFTLNSQREIVRYSKKDNHD